MQKHFLKENKMPKFNSYQEAVEYRNEKLADEYYNEEEEQQDEMDKADEIYDMLQDEEASK